MGRLRNDSAGISMIRRAVEESRRGFQSDLQRDLDCVLQESLRTYQRENGNVQDEETKAVEDSIKTYENQQNEQEFLDQAIRNSLAVEPQNIPGNITQAQADILADAVQNASNYNISRNDLAQSPIVQQAVMLGFSQDLAIQAVMQFGHDQDAVLNYLLNLGLDS